MGTKTGVLFSGRDMNCGKWKKLRGPSQFVSYPSPNIGKMSTWRPR